MIDETDSSTISHLIKDLPIMLLDQLSLVVKMNVIYDMAFVCIMQINDV